MKIVDYRELLGKSMILASLNYDFFSEIAIHSKLVINKVNIKDHPNIIKLIEVIEDPIRKKHYIVSELQQGGTLFSKKYWSYFNSFQNLDESNSMIGFDYSIKIILDLMSAIEYCKNYGLYLVHNMKRIAHRDIKPDNILFNESLELKITDFGVSEDFEGKPSTLSTTRSGTRIFHSPEQYNSMRSIKTR